MILKEQEDSRRDIAALERLMASPRAVAATRARIAEQIRNLRSGDRGEAEAAYGIKFNYGASRNWMVINDLRLEHDGLVAQIDHLLINRFLEFWVLETKRFAHGVKINEHGEFLTVVDNRPVGRGSPIEQNRRHVLLLQRIIDAGVIELPKRLGMTLKPRLYSLVLISQGAISRPKAPVPGLDTVIKTDQLRLKLDQAIDAAPALLLTKLVGQSTLESVGRQMLALHRPMVRDWAAQFGLRAGQARDEVRESTRLSETPPPVLPPPEAAPHCQRCGSAVSRGIAHFCNTTPRFAGRTYCISCQKDVAAVRITA